MAVNPLDVYGIVADPALSADEKRSKIDMLYGAGVPAAVAPVPDERIASTTGDDRAAINSALSDPSLSQTSANGPKMLDVGGGLSMQTAPPPAAPAPAADIDPRSIIAANSKMPVMSAAEVPGLAAEATRPKTAAASIHPIVAAGVAPSGEAPVEPQSPTDDQLLTAGVGTLIRGALRGSPARRVAAHDQPTASVIEKTAPLPDDVKERLATDAEAEAGLALNEGEEAGKAHLDAAIAADNTAHQARTDEAQLQEANKRAEAHVQHLDQQFEQMVKDTAIKPSDWWASKDAGHKVLSVISAIMFGLGGSPQGLQKVIDDDLAMKERMRQSKLGAFRQRIDDFKSRLMSPEAQHASERALAAQAVAADANRLAESAAAPEARLRAQQVAQHFQSEFDQWSAKMAASEAGTVRTNIAHVPDRVVGGAPDPMTVLKKAKELGLSPEETIKVLMGGQYGTGANPEEGKRRVTLSDGHVGYVANEGQQKDTQEIVSAVGGLKNAYARILDLTKSSGHTIAGKEKAQLQANIAVATQKLQAMAKGEGSNARMAGEMLERLGPLTGEAALSTGTLDANARAQIQEAYRLANEQEESVKGILTPSPKTAPSGGKIRTLGKSKEDLGFEPSG